MLWAYDCGKHYFIDFLGSVSVAARCFCLNVPAPGIVSWLGVLDYDSLVISGLETLNTNYYNS
jgi:hypothetical protein